MTHLADGALYDYTPPLVDGELAIGWLGAGHEFSTGSIAPRLLRRLVVDRLMFAAAFLPSGTAALMGVHQCEFCDGPTKPLPGRGLWGSGEFRVVSDDGTTFVAPSLIAHYVDRHQYYPTTAFLEAVAVGRFLEQPTDIEPMPTIDEVELAPPELTQATGVTNVVRAHLEPWDGSVGRPILGIVMERKWFGPWDGTVASAQELIADDRWLGVAP